MDVRSNIQQCHESVQFSCHYIVDFPIKDGHFLKNFHLFEIYHSTKHQFVESSLFRARRSVFLAKRCTFRLARDYPWREMVTSDPFSSRSLFSQDLHSDFRILTWRRSRNLPKFRCTLARPAPRTTSFADNPVFEPRASSFASKGGNCLLSTLEARTSQV